MVATNEEHTSRVQHKLEELSPDLPQRLYCAWLSREPGMEQELLNYIRLALAQGRDIAEQHYREVVRRVLLAERHVRGEAHAFTQFIRFVQVGETVYLADIAPRYDVLEMLVGEFVHRLAGFNFLIRDTKRSKCLVWDGSSFWISYEPELLAPPTPKGGHYEQMWQTYFAKIAIPERINPKLQALHVPRRYRNFMTEFQKNSTSASPNRELPSL